MNTRVTIQLVSDVHLEFNPRAYGDRCFEEFGRLVTPVADILVLAGDICTIKHIIILDKFLQYCAENWKHVVFVPGNHEYYGGNKFENISIVDGKLNSLCAKHGIHFLQKDSVVIGDVMIFGCTMWTDVNGFELIVRNYMNDFQMIRQFDLESWKWHHEDHRAWLLRALDGRVHSKKIVVTHHAPLLQGCASESYERGNQHRAFASDLSDLVAKCNAWIFGHTHHRTQIRAFGATLATYAIGYHGELPQERNHEQMTIKI